jgi:hypothetical protein
MHPMPHPCLHGCLTNRGHSIYRLWLYDGRGVHDSALQDESTKVLNGIICESYKAYIYSVARGLGF